jgi:membrane-bound lytic murein transglycosylase MltF
VLLDHPEPTRSDALPSLLSDQFSGDLEEMRDRGVIRVLVTYNRTNYFLEGPQARGFEYELLEAYGKALNTRKSGDGLHTEMVYIPLPLDELIPALLDGRGDIAAAGLTITPERSQQVTFTEPYIDDVREVVVGHLDQPAMTSVEELSAKRIFVVRGSSYAQHLKALDARLTEQGKEPILISEVVSNMQTEELLEMVERGVIDYMVADNHIAELWQARYPHLQIHAQIPISDAGKIAWAVRPSNPELRESLNRFIVEHRKGSLMGNILFSRYFDKNRWLDDPLGGKSGERLREIAGLLQQYAAKYDFEWLLIAAQAFQESRFDQSKKSHVGALGVMQIRPTTAADKAVAIRHIDRLEENIHAGVKYLAHLRDHYFDAPELDAEARRYFALAAYNAGPGRVRKMREHAVEMGLDPNRWIGNTELAALEIVGQETVRYVRNIIRYYSTYRTALEQRQDLQQMLPEQPAGAAQTHEDLRLMHLGRESRARPTYWIATRLLFRPAR